MPSNLPLKLHTTYAGWEAVKNWCNLATKKSRLCSFYSWAHRRGYIAKPIEFDAVKTPPSAPIGILANHEVASLLEHASSLLGHLWLSLCLGLRVAEASRTQALECRDNYLIVGAKASKTRSRRVIALPEGHKERGDRAIQLSSRSGVRVYSDRGKRIGPVFSSVEKAQDFLNRN